MNSIQLKNLKEGDLGENSVLPVLEKYFDIRLTKTSKNFVFDFRDNYGTYYEVKSRNNNYNKYPTTMVGYNKIEYANKLDKPVYFIFNFLDGIYYYEYEIHKLDELEIKIGGRCDRGKYEYKKYCYIPINKLIKIDLDNIPPTPNRIILEVKLNKKVIECLRENEVQEILYSV